MAAERSRTTREQLLTQVVCRAAFSPASVGLASAALVFAFYPGTWLAACAAAVLDLAVIVFQARHPSFIRRVSEEMHYDHWCEQLVRAEQLQKNLDRATATLISNIIRSQERLFSLAGETEALAPGRSQSAALLADCLQLAQRRQELRNFLAETRAADLDREIERLRRHACSSSDSVARDLLEHALSQKQSERESLRAIEHAIVRIDGQLEAVQATCDSIVGRIMRLRVTTATTPSADQRNVLQELQHLSRNVSALEASLDESLAVRAAP